MNKNSNDEMNMALQWLTNKKHQWSNNEPAVWWEELALVVDEHVRLDQKCRLNLDHDYQIKLQTKINSHDLLDHIRDQIVNKFHWSELIQKSAIAPTLMI